MAVDANHQDLLNFRLNQLLRLPLPALASESFVALRKCRRLPIAAAC